MIIAHAKLHEKMISTLVTEQKIRNPNELLGFLFKKLFAIAGKKLIKKL